jgi:O-antigen/teichoic acid export membrane protein
LSVSPERRFGRSAAGLSIGIAATGVVTYAYFSLASHALGDADYGRLTLLWSAVFIVASVLYRPIEQLLSRTIAERTALGIVSTDHLGVAAGIQLALAGGFLAVALASREMLQHGLFGGSAELYTMFVVAVVAYSASYFARGYLAGERRFRLYGALVLCESVFRFAFALAVAVGLARGVSIVALGIAAAPIASLSVVPWYLVSSARAKARQATEGDTHGAPASERFSFSRGATFTAAVIAIMIAEQTLLNAGPLLVYVTHDEAGVALAGFAFNVLFVPRAALQLFQATQASILPHLTRMRAMGQADAFRGTVRRTVAVVAAFAVVVAVVMLVAGPGVMEVLFGSGGSYDRVGLAWVAIGMGLFLVAATLNQAALARGRHRHAAMAWAVAAAAYVVMLLVDVTVDPLLHLELAYVASGLLLCVLMVLVYRLSAPAAEIPTPQTRRQPGFP